MFKDNTFGTLTKFYGGFNQLCSRDSSISSIAKTKSSDCWKECADAIIERLAEADYHFEIIYLNYNGFELEEIT